MGYYSFVAIFFVVTIVFFVIEKILRIKSPDFLRREENRINALDGLRGFLSLSVVIHHFGVRLWEIRVGVWSLPPSGFFVLLGQGSVAIFFMITGFLFWGKSKDFGFNVKKWGALYINRFFRIVPMYQLVVVIYIALLLVFNDSSKLNGLFMREAFPWLMFGIYHNPREILGDRFLVHAVIQMWSIFYEWGFYFSLPFIALVLRPRYRLFSLSILLSVAIACAVVFRVEKLFFVIHFLIGMLSGEARFKKIYRENDKVWKSFLFVLLVLLLSLVGVSAYSLVETLFLGVIFLLVVSGSSVFGLFKTKAAIALGHVSYSVYMLHCLILIALLGNNSLGVWFVRAPWSFWLSIFMGIIFTIFFSVITFRFIELPCIALGRRLAALDGERSK